MGAKGLKAIIVDRQGSIPAEIADQDRFQKAAKAYAKFLIIFIRCVIGNQHGLILNL